MTCLVPTMSAVARWRPVLSAAIVAVIASTVVTTKAVHAGPGDHRALALSPIVDSPVFSGDWDLRALYTQRHGWTQTLVRDGAVSKNSVSSVVVSSCADDGEPGTLRSAIAGATDGDTIDLSELDCGSIVLAGGEIDVPMNDIAIEGPGRESLRLDGADESRIFSHTGQGTLAIHGMTLARGRVMDGSGGCVSSQSGSVALVDAAVDGCTAHTQTNASGFAGGGGIFAAGDISIIRSRVVGNTASTDAAVAIAGGGLLTWANEKGPAGRIDVVDSVVTGNQVLSTTTETVTTSGGGLESSGLVTIVRSTVSENLVSSAAEDIEEESITRGGGLQAFGLTVVDSTFSGNRVLNSSGAQDVAGGAIAVSGAASISGSTIENNHSGMIAGGVVQSGGVPGVSRLELVNSTVSENTAGFAGAGLAIFDGMTMRNSTIAFNAVDDMSPFGIGGVLLGSNDTTGAFHVESSIISNNLAADKAMFAADLAVFMSDTITTIVGANNIVGEISGAQMPDDTVTDDPLLAPLADNGGRTRTCALSKGSPALDAGNNSAGLNADQRGLFHVRTFGANTDIGAFEFQPTPDRIFEGRFDP